MALDSIEPYRSRLNIPFTHLVETPNVSTSTVMQKKTTSDTKPITSNIARPSKPHNTNAASDCSMQ